MKRIAMWLLAVAVLSAALLAFYLWNRRRWRVVLRSLIRLEGEDGNEVRFDPPEPSQRDFMGVVACYTAKIHWLLASEPPEARQGFLDLLRAAVEGDWGQDDPLEAELVRRQGWQQVGLDEPPVAEFYLELLRNGKGGWFFRNTLPPQSMIGSWMMSYILLLVEVLDQLPARGRRTLQLTLAGLLPVLSSPRGLSSELADLAFLYELTRVNLELARGQETL